MEQKFDPKLKTAMEEIKEVCRRHDIACDVMLASPTHTEFYHGWDDFSWSAITFDIVDGHQAIRIRAKGADQYQVKRLESTCHMLYSFRDIHAGMFIDIETITKKLEEKIRIDHNIELSRVSDEQVIVD